MTALLFIVVLVALIVVHEFGHFVVAKLSGMRVDEFGIGYPPRAWGRTYGETEYTLNWLPFGGFVRIFGEDEGTAQGEVLVQNPRAFGARPRILQALTLLAGIAMNLFFGYLLISATLFIGTARVLTPEEVPQAQDVRLVIANVLPESPAADGGLVQGDVITSVKSPSGELEVLSPEAFTTYIGEATETALTFDVLRGEETLTISATPEKGVIVAKPERVALGVAVASVGIIPVSLMRSPVEGAVLTWEITKQTAIGLTAFFGSIFTFSADLSQVAGPVGIAGAVGSAYADGITALMTITALISINLALINFLPIPALDGGRLLFVIIEAITRRPIKPVVSRVVNGTGFAFLILLMVVITAHDIFKLVA
jgi:regulator of sigma E protease